MRIKSENLWVSHDDVKKYISRSSRQSMLSLKDEENLTLSFYYHRNDISTRVDVWFLPLAIIKVTFWFQVQFTFIWIYFDIWCKHSITNVEGETTFGSFQSKHQSKFNACLELSPKKISHDRANKSCHTLWYLWRTDCRVTCWRSVATIFFY